MSFPPVPPARFSGILRLFMACGLVSSSIGADSTTVSLAEKEIQRRSQFLGEQVKKLEAADTHLIQGDSAAAYAPSG